MPKSKSRNTSLLAFSLKQVEFLQNRILFLEERLDFMQLIITDYRARLKRLEPGYHPPELGEATDDYTPLLDDEDFHARLKSRDKPLDPDYDK